MHHRFQLTSSYFTVYHYFSMTKFTFSIKGNKLCFINNHNYKSYWHSVQSLRGPSQWFPMHLIFHWFWEFEHPTTKWPSFSSTHVFAGALYVGHPTARLNNFLQLFINQVASIIICSDLSVCNQFGFTSITGATLFHIKSISMCLR